MSRYLDVENFFRQQRFHSLRRIVLVSLCGLILFGPLSLLGFTANTQEIVGTTLIQHGEITDGGTIPYVMVRLSDGQVVRARYDVTIPLRRDRRVVLKETTTMFFG